MRPYEVMIIFDPTLEDDAVRAEVDRSSELIRSKGGDPGRVERWGKRRLAYEILRHREGSYVVLEAQAEPAVMADLSRALTLTDGILRHKGVHLPEKASGKPARPLLGTVGPGGTVGSDETPPSRDAAPSAPAPATVAANPTATEST